MFDVYPGNLNHRKKYVRVSIHSRCFLAAYLRFENHLFSIDIYILYSVQPSTTSTQHTNFGVIGLSRQIKSIIN